MKILNHKQIHQKIQRLAIEILENNYKENEIILLGINRTGMKFAESLHKRLQEISEISFRLGNIKINPKDPLSQDILTDIPLEELNGKTIVVVDDVANTGRTLFYACKPIMDILPAKLETAVLANRTHKNFPISVSYVGLSLATTMKDHIKVEILNGEMAVYLE